MFVGAGFSMLCRLNSYAQAEHDTSSNPTVYSTHPPKQQDTNTYKPRKIKLDEVDFVSGYYNQNGGHSAETGGIGAKRLLI